MRARATVESGTRPRLERQFYRVRDVTEITGVSKGKVFQALKSGRLKGLKLDGVLLIPAESFEDWVGTAVPYLQLASRQEDRGH